MNDQFLQGVIFDWNRIDNDSYLKRIEAFGGVKKLDFNRSEERRVGKECLRLCRSRWSPYH